MPDLDEHSCSALVVLGATPELCGGPATHTHPIGEGFAGDAYRCDDHKAVVVHREKFCYFCEKDGKPNVTATFDGETKLGPWAYMCDEHFAEFGVGLGIGKGQELVLVDEWNLRHWLPQRRDGDHPSDPPPFFPHALMTRS